MSNERHSFIAFYPSDWIGGTSRMTPMQELVYFRVCVFIWDKAEPCPASELPLLLGTVEGWQTIINDLITAKKLNRTPDGSVTNNRALNEAITAHDLWSKKSLGGKNGASRRWANDGTPKQTANSTPINTPNTSPIDSPNDTSMGLPMENQNHNQIVKEKRKKKKMGDPSGEPSAAAIWKSKVWSVQKGIRTPTTCITEQEITRMVEQGDVNTKQAEAFGWRDPMLGNLKRRPITAQSDEQQP